MKLLQRLSLRMKMLGTVIVILVTIVLGTAYNVSEFRSTFQEKEREEFQAFASSISEAFAAQMYERYTDVQAFAANPAVASMNPEGMSAHLDKFVSLYGIYDLILVVHKSGHLISASGKDAQGKTVNLEALKFLDYSKESWFQAVMAGRTTDDATKGFVGTYIEDFLRDPMLEKAFGEVRYGSSFSTAIKNEKGEIVGVITNRTNPKWFETEVISKWKNMREFGLPTPQIVVVNENADVILSHSPQDEKNIITHDENTLLKLNLKKYDAYDLAQKETEGFTYAHNLRTGEDEAVGFSKIHEEKWPSNLNWTVFVQESKENVAMASTKATWHFVFVMAFNIFIALVFATWVAVLISKTIDDQIKILSRNSVEVSEASKSIADQSTKLSESATEQAAALQETVAAVDEISAMVGKNSESALRSKEVSSQSREAAERGRHTVETMLNSMNDINATNEQIRTQMEESNRGMSEITTLINEIGTKTKVINEIVLQTKLLSFNASVEAARAGESGKGFAVVAEEVGNLAQMSGNAAKEISDLLEQSVQKVHSIAEETKMKVDRLMVDAQEKVTAGSANVQECSDVLNEILSQVSSVDSLVSEIAVASQEQALGISEISKAVSQMEQVTNQNSSVANASSSSAEKLNIQAQGLDSVVQQLVKQIRGGSQSEKIFVNEVKKPTESSAKPKASVTDVKSLTSPPTKVSLKSKEKETLKTKKTLEPVEGKVVTMTKTTKASKPLSHEPQKNVVHADHTEKFAMKNASGADFTPSADDPGFKE